MNKFLLLILICFIIPINTACADNAGSSKEVNISQDNNSAGAESMENISVKLDINGKIFNAVFYNNETAQKFAEMLPVTMNMSELNGNEKYYYLNTTLPVNSERVGTIKKGDIMLYGNNCIVIFYESFNTSYSYTKIGYIENPDNLAAALGKGSVSVSFKK